MFYKIMKLDLNGGKQLSPTIEERYARESTNDIGDPLTAESAFIIISEFKKFMHIACVEIFDLKNSGKITASVVGD